MKLLSLDEYGPERRPRLGEMTAWEGACRMAYHLSREGEDGRGVEGAADVCRAMGSNAEAVERLARLLYNHYDWKGDSPNSVMFNNLVTEWPNIQALVALRRCVGILEARQREDGASGLVRVGDAGPLVGGLESAPEAAGQG